MDSIKIENLRAIAWHLDQGEDNGGLERAALANFLRSAADSTEENREAGATVAVAFLEGALRYTEEIARLRAACEDALSYFEASWKQVGEHHAAAEVPYVYDLREALKHE
jgi:hypothetical protein